MRAAGYVRVSSQEQITGTSLDTQRQAIEKYCAALGYDLVTVFQDPGVSGAKKLADRPGGAELIAAITEGTIEAVVILKLNRGFRNAADAISTIRAWDEAGIGVHIIDMHIDTKTPVGRMFLGIMACVDEFERESIRERGDTGRAARKATGHRLGHDPFGYTSDESGKLTPNADEQEIIRLTQELKTLGMSAAAIAAELNRRELHTKRGKSWTHTQVVRILKAA